jgi:hypothetical protein
MAGPPAGQAETARAAAIARAELRFESYLAAEGEAICLASLPMMAEQIAADQAGGDAALCAEITARLRRRAGLHAV